jgi:hypothetical protein
MRTANQLTFSTHEATLKPMPNDSGRVIFEDIDWSFIHPQAACGYSGMPQGAEGCDPIALFKTQFSIYLGEVSSDRKLTSSLRYNARLSLLCTFNFLKVRQVKLNVSNSSAFAIDP